MKLSLISYKKYPFILAFMWSRNIGQLFPGHFQKSKCQTEQLFTVHFSSSWIHIWLCHLSIFDESSETEASIGFFLNFYGYFSNHTWICTKFKGELLLRSKIIVINENISGLSK